MSVVRISHYHKLHHSASRLEKLDSFIVREVLQRAAIDVCDLIVHSQLSISVMYVYVCVCVCVCV